MFQAKVSSGSIKNGELTLALSTTLTKALISFKEKKKAEEAKRLEEEAKRRAEELAAPKVCIFIQPMIGGLHIQALDLGTARPCSNSARLQAAIAGTVCIAGAINPTSIGCFSNSSSNANDVYGR